MAWLDQSLKRHMANLSPICIWEERREKRMEGKQSGLTIRALRDEARHAVLLLLLQPRFAGVPFIPIPNPCFLPLPKNDPELPSFRPDPAWRLMPSPSTLAALAMIPRLPCCADAKPLQI